MTVSAIFSICRQSWLCRDCLGKIWPPGILQWNYLVRQPIFPQPLIMMLTRIRVLFRSFRRQGERSDSRATPSLVSISPTLVNLVSEGVYIARNHSPHRFSLTNRYHPTRNVFSLIHQINGLAQVPINDSLALPRPSDPTPVQSIHGVKQVPYSSSCVTAQ